jgi:hypothetical protein
MLRTQSSPAVTKVRRFSGAARALGAAVVIGSLASLTGCVATVGPDPDYAVATDVPPNIETYPHTNYEGRDVYLVNDRWYYQGTGNAWVYYRQAPRPLVERRETVLRQRPYVQAAPPAARVEPAPRYEGSYRREIDPGLRRPEPAVQVR